MAISTRTCLCAAAIWICLLPAGQAQQAGTAGVAGPTPAATLDTGAMVKLGSDLVQGTGGAERDVPAGLKLLEDAVAAGDIAAMGVLGKMLLDGYYVDADPARAVPLLEQAASGGDRLAQGSLGAALIWGIGIERHVARGAAYLAMAADRGDIKSKRILGQQLVGGWDLQKDTVVGLAMLEEAVAAGDAEARIALGSFLLYGTDLPPDRARALRLFEEAAEAGNGAGLMHYGSWLMWGERGPASVAEDYLRRAAELGEGKAWVTLASGAMWGYLGPRARKKFGEFAEKATASGETGIALLEAERRIWGIGQRASGPGALAVLEAAAAEGNRDALIRLIGLERDGNRYNIRKNTARAREHLAEYGSVLTPAELAQMNFTIDAAKMKNAAYFPALKAKLVEDSLLRSKLFAEELYLANPNFAIYLLQAEMRDTGRYRGKLNGLATRQTIRSLYRACIALKAGHDCREGVLGSKVVAALLYEALPE